MKNLATIAHGIDAAVEHYLTGHFQELRRQIHGLSRIRDGYATDAPETLVEFAGLRRQGRGTHSKYALGLGGLLTITRWTTREKP